MKKYLLLSTAILGSILVKAQTDPTMNPNNHAYYSRYYDVPPHFPDMYSGGAFQYFSDHVQYPYGTTASVSGQINIHAIVDTTGAIIDPLVVRGISPAVDQEFLKLLANTPHFQPAIYKGHKVPVFFAVVMNAIIDADAKTINATRDAQAQIKEMQWAKKLYDVKPAFTADHNNLYKYVADNIKYPQGATADADGIMQLRFRVDTMGDVKDISIVKTLSKDADQAMMDALSQVPRFKPGMLGTKKVEVGFTFAMHVTINTASKTVIAQQITTPSKTTASDSLSKDPNMVFTAVEVLPAYPGGEKAFGKFLQDNIRYPAYARKNKVQGKVFVRFVVERDGSLTDITVMRTPSVDLGEEAVRVLKQCDKWTPGLQNDKPVRVQFTVPINFSL